MLFNINLFSGVSGFSGLSVLSQQRSYWSAAGFAPKLFRGLVPRVFLSAALVMSPGLSAFATELLDINQADVTTIAETLDGIGPAKAQAIVDYRLQYGTFVQLDELTNVPGIGDATLAQIKSLITVGDSGLADIGPAETGSTE